jgi:hypothetical protein
MSDHRIDSPSFARDAIPALVVLALAIASVACAATVSWW